MNYAARQAALENSAIILDSRNRVHGWPEGFDEGSMTITLTVMDDEGEESEVELPAIFEVCPTCDGRGRHTNPSIDCMGISSEQFDEDPDFRDDYFSGRFDVPCNACGGRRVYPAADTSNHPEIARYLEQKERDDAAYAAERAAEARMGC